MTALALLALGAVACLAALKASSSFLGFASRALHREARNARRAFARLPPPGARVVTVRVKVARARGVTWLNHTTPSGASTYVLSSPSRLVSVRLVFYPTLPP